MASNPRRRKVVSEVSQAWQRFYASPDGRAAVAEFLMSCNVYSPIVETDAIVAARLEGERHAALRLLTLLSLRPSDFVSQAQEDTDILDRLVRG